MQPKARPTTKRLRLPVALLLTGWGVITPTMRVEYRYAWDSRLNQFMWYSGLGPGNPYLLIQDATSRNLLSTSVGVRVSVSPAVTAELEYGTTAAASSTVVQTLRAAIRFAF
jgi:hypothetical protein